MQQRPSVLLFSYGYESSRTLSQNVPPVKRLSNPASGGSADGACDGERARRAAGLGNNTKLQAAFGGVTCPQTGVVTSFSLKNARRESAQIPVEIVDAETSKRDSRNSRFLLQSSATKLLFNHETPRGKQWRVTGCHRRKIGDEVTINYSEAIKKAHFGNVMVCGSVWTCPVCASKISEKRKREISEATNIHKAAGGGLAMITLTFSHTRNNVLKPMLKALARATASLRSHRAYKALLKEVGYVGHIRALEVTFGDANGAHPHIHDLWLTEKPLTRAQVRKINATLFEIWETACVSHGLGRPNRKRGVNVKEMESAADYIAKFGREPKWGVGSELSKQHLKKGKENRWSAFDLLRKYQDGDLRAGAMFIEYAEAFFGAEQIVWSRGLKQLFMIEEKSDEQIAKEQQNDAVVLARVTPEEWKMILHRRIDQRAVLLDIAETGGFAAVRLFLDALMGRVMEQVELDLPAPLPNTEPDLVLPVRKYYGDPVSGGQIAAMNRAVEKERQRFAAEYALNPLLRLSDVDIGIMKAHGLFPHRK